MPVFIETRKTLGTVAVVAIAACVLASPAAAYAAQTVAGLPVRSTDVETAAPGKVLVGLKGSFDQTSKEKILARVNAIRKEACDEGVPTPGNPSVRLKPSDYKPLVWSSDLEYITMLRSAEASITVGHIRADGGDIWLTAPSGQQGWAEDLAWNYSDALQGIEQFYGEKADWVKQNSSAITGHYTSMINPRYASVGVSAFLQAAGDSASWPCTVAMQLSPYAPTSSQKIAPAGKLYQLVQMNASSVSSLKLKGLSGSLAVGSSKQAYVTCTVSYNSRKTSSAILTGPFAWSSNDATVASVSQDGGVTGVSAGTAKVTASLPGIGSASVGVTVGKTADELAAVRSKSASVKAKATTKVKVGPATGASGAKISYAKVSGTAKAKVSKGGAVTVSKGLKKGKSYKVVCKASCAGQQKKITLTLKVR